MKPLRLTTLLFVLFVISGCGNVVEQGMKPAIDWSRSVAVGQSAGGSLGMAVEDSGERVHLVWPAVAGEAAEAAHIRYVQLDSLAKVVIERKLELSPGRLRATRLVLANDGKIHLFWAVRLVGADNWALWHVLLDPNGRPVGDARKLSVQNINVGDYNIVSDGSGGAIVVWDGGDKAGLYGLRLTADGRIGSDVVQIASSGVSPTVRLDSGSGLHLAWLDEPQLLYEFFPTANLRHTVGVPIANLKLGARDSLTGLVTGLSDGWVYVIWSVQSQSALEVGTARTEYVAFPINAPVWATPTRLWLLPAEEQLYAEYQGTFQLTQLAAPTDVRSGSEHLEQPVAVDGQQADLAVAFSMSQQFRLDSEIQIAVGVFSAGEFTGHEMAGKTANLSRQANLSTDSMGDLYLAWREGAAGNKVYFATTAPMARDALDKLSIGYILNGLLLGSLESITSILLFPLAFVWLLPGLFLLGLWKLRRDTESLADSTSLALLFVAVILYQMTKLLFMPTIASYVPFSAWLDIPAAWRLPLRISVPMVILGLAILGANLVRRRSSESTLLFFFSLAATDAVLTLAVYGVNFLGVF